MDARGRMMLFEEIQIELFEHLRQAFIKAHFGAELLELLIRGSVHREVVKQALHVSEFVVLPLRLDQILAAFPEFLRVNPESGKNNVILHIKGAQRLVVIVNKRDCVLQRGSHGVKDSPRRHSEHGFVPPVGR